LKIDYLILIFIFFVSTSQAQLIRGYGFKAGVTSSNQDWDYNYLKDFTPETRWGINVGIFSEFLNIHYFSLVAELNYVQKGMKDEIAIITPQSPDPTKFITWDTRVDYLNLSALGKFRYEFQSFIPYILLGPKIDFQINEETSPESVNVVANNFNEFMYGFKVGVGSEIKFVSFSLSVEILYDYNINHLYEGEYLTVNSDSFDFRIGIMF
jgi:hypothetical protein